MSVYRPLAAGHLTSAAKSTERRLLLGLLRWYDALIACLTIPLVFGIVIPVARVYPTFWLWPAGVCVYASVCVATTNDAFLARLMWLLVYKASPHAARAPLRRLYRRIDRAFASASKRILAYDRSRRQRALAIVLFVAATAFLMTVRLANQSLGFPVDSTATWLIYILPIQLIARNGSLRWLAAICALTFVAALLANWVLHVPVLFETGRIVVVKALWLVIICLMPTLLQMYLADRQLGLDATIKVLRAITNVRLPLNTDFGNTVAAIISEELGYPMVNILLATAPGDRAGEGLRMIGSSTGQGRHLVFQCFFIPAGKGITNWVAAHKRVCIVNNVRRDTRHRFLYSDDVPRTKSEVAIPIVLRDTLLGVLDVQSEQAYAFSEDDVAVLKAIATHLAVAMDNAQNLARARGLYAVACSTSQRLVQHRNPFHALQDIVKVARDVLHADLVVLYARHEPGGRISGPVFDGETHGPISPAERVYQNPHSVARQMMNALEPVFITHVPESRALGSRQAGATGAAGEASFVEREGIRSTAAIPLRFSEGRTSISLGVIFVNYRHPHAFNDEYQEWFRALADLAVLALRNAALHQLVARDERANLWQDIHDGMSQYTSFTRMLLEQVVGAYERTRVITEDDGEKLVLARRCSQALQQQVNYLLGIWRASSRDVSLFSEMAEYAQIVRETLDVECAFFSAGSDESLGKELEHDTRMIIREAVHNAHRHGQATCIRIDVRLRGRVLAIGVANNGRGFDVNAIGTVGGLGNIRQRVASRGGRFHLVSHPSARSEGTRILIALPLPANGMAVAPADDVWTLPAEAQRTMG